MISPFFRRIRFFLGSDTLEAETFPVSMPAICFFTPSEMIRISSSLSLYKSETASSSIYWERLSRSVPFRAKILASMTVPSTPGGTRRDVSRTSLAFSPKMARSSFSSDESCVSPLGVIFPTRMSPGFTATPMQTIPLSSRFLRASSPRFGISRVISSLPSLVSRAMVSNSSIWIEV
ncbi:MAG: hypothetical protein ACD_87C00064G0002 [uncultured bacterium]|nr:MAG: hypothetical protein ACD_87C00064G0002 [uncultured bacterium]